MAGIGCATFEHRLKPGHHVATPQGMPGLRMAGEKMVANSVDRGVGISGCGYSVQHQFRADTLHIQVIPGAKESQEMQRKGYSLFATRKEQPSYRENDKRFPYHSIRLCLKRT